MPYRRRAARLALEAVLVVLAGVFAWLLVSDARRGDAPHGGPRLHACRTSTGGVAMTEADVCMVRVAGGRFRMGAQSTDASRPGYDASASPDEAPPHEVQLSPYWLSISEITTQQFAACVKAGRCREADVLHPGGDFNYDVVGRHLQPMNGVSWKGARDFCASLGGRLPTEAEWERAARNGDGRTYPWGDEPADCLHAVMHPAGQAAGCGLDHTQEVWVAPKVGQQPLGLRDLAGNVWEWTADWYDERYYERSPAKDPRGPETGTRKVQRGGSFASTDPVELRSAYRAALEPDVRQADTGFRCAADEGQVDPRP